MTLAWSSVPPSYDAHGAYWMAGQNGRIHFGVFYRSGWNRETNSEERVLRVSHDSIVNGSTVESLFADGTLAAVYGPLDIDKPPPVELPAKVGASLVASYRRDQEWIARYGFAPMSNDGEIG